MVCLWSEYLGYSVFNCNTITCWTQYNVHTEGVIVDYLVLQEIYQILLPKLLKPHYQILHFLLLISE